VMVRAAWDYGHLCGAAWGVAHAVDRLRAADGASGELAS